MFVGDFGREIWTSLRFFFDFMRGKPETRAQKNAHEKGKPDFDQAFRFVSLSLFSVPFRYIRSSYPYLAHLPLKWKLNILMCGFFQILSLTNSVSPNGEGTRPFFPADEPRYDARYDQNNNAERGATEGFQMNGLGPGRTGNGRSR